MLGDGGSGAMQNAREARRPTGKEVAAGVFGAILGAAATLALATAIVSPAFSATTRHWAPGFDQLLRWLRQPLIYPFWISLMTVAGLAGGSEVVLWSWRRWRGRQ